MKTFENQDFDSFEDRDSRAVFSDIEFRKCCFRSCIISVTKDPALRSVVKNVRMSQCSQRGCTIYPGVFENVVIDGLNTNGQLVQSWGAAFNQVVLRGKIDRLMLSSIVDVMGDEPDVQDAFDRANAEYYRNVEWALDIRDGEFKELSIKGVPAELIRRDPETQVVVTREQAANSNWQELPFHENLWPITLQLFLKGTDADVILAAPKRHPKFRRYLEDIRTLQKAGVTQQD